MEVADGEPIFRHKKWFSVRPDRYFKIGAYAVLAPVPGHRRRERIGLIASDGERVCLRPGIIRGIDDPVSSTINSDVVDLCCDFTIRVHGDVNQFMETQIIS